MLGVARCEVVVWWVDAASTDAIGAGVLDPREIVRAEQAGHAPSGHASRTAALLLRHAVAREGGIAAREVVVDRSCPDCARWHGRPQIVGVPGLEVSISHAGDRVGVAVGRGVPIGLDVEARAELPNPPEQAVLASVLDSAELARYPCGQLCADSFGVYWVRKEAVLKATGEGLRRPMPTLRVSPPDLPPQLQHGPADLPDRTVLATLLLGDAEYLAALAAVAKPGTRAPELDVDERDGRELLP